jgi:hypothetical protein
MTPEERDIISRFIARVGGGAPASSFTPGSVPATQQNQPLPPIDPEADRFISDQFNAYPAARYRITQMAFVQEAALAEAQNRIKRLEYELQQRQAQPQPQGQSRGFFSGLFGGGQSAPQQPQYQQYAPPPQASYPPGYQPGMFGGGGSGFLGSALTTAAGVAGGVLAADALTSMFSPHYGGGWGGGGFGGGGWGGGGFGGGEVVNETVVNNYGDAGGTAGGGGDPWGGAGTTDAASGGGWNDPGQADPGQSGDWGSSGDTGGGDWGGGDAGGSWDDNSGGGGGDGSF